MPLHVRRTRSPTLTLVYLPHLDYDLQRFGPDDPRIAASLREIDAVAGDLIDDAERDGARVIVLSEYGITPVSTPVHINRALREAGLLRRAPRGRRRAARRAAVACLRGRRPPDRARLRGRARLDRRGAAHRRVRLPGVEQVLDRGEQRAHRTRSSALGRARRARAAATPGSPITTGSTTRAPDFARLVEIHRKPGYDPVELFLDPAIRFPKLAVGWRLARRALGFRTLMDVIPLDATLVKGSHGRLDGRRSRRVRCSYRANAAAAARQGRSPRPR